MRKKWKARPLWLKISILTFLFLLLSEIILRFIFGLGDLATYRTDSAYEYFYKANQRVFRFGNLIETNEFGMRSKKINKKKKIKILAFGDSVLNGGAHVDQNDLFTTIEEIELNNEFNNEVQILNISAQSWGLSNAFSFLKKHGNFNASVIVLVFSSHDLNDNMHFREVVGHHPAWPSQKPWLALTDLWSRFIWPKTKSVFTGENEYSYLDGFDDSKINPGWNKFFRYCKKRNIPLLVYLHASKEETNSGSYNDKGKEIIRLCKKNRIQLIPDLKLLSNNEEAFIDNIHLNNKGHLLMQKLMDKPIKDLIRQIEL